MSLCPCVSVSLCLCTHWWRNSSNSIHKLDSNPHTVQYAAISRIRIKQIRTPLSKPSTRIPKKETKKTKNPSLPSRRRNRYFRKKTTTKWHGCDDGTPTSIKRGQGLNSKFSTVVCHWGNLGPRSRRFSSFFLQKNGGCVLADRSPPSFRVASISASSSCGRVYYI